MGTEEEEAGDGGQWGDEGDLGEEVEEEVEKKKTKGMCAKLMKFFASLGGEHRAGKNLVWFPTTMNVHRRSLGNMTGGKTMLVSPFLPLF